MGRPRTVNETERRAHVDALETLGRLIFAGRRTLAAHRAFVLFSYDEMWVRFSSLERAAAA
jgi:hypothetical protein